MAYNLKKFATEADYEAAISTLNYPAVSWVESGDTLHYDLTQPPAPKVEATIQVTTTSKPTVILGSNKAFSGVSKIYIDDVELPNVDEYYTFSTTGIHTIKYELTDSTTIPYRMFYRTVNILDATIPSSVTTIEDEAFYRRPSSDGSLYVHPLTPPTLGPNALYFEEPNVPHIMVQAASGNDYKAASGWSTYAAYIEPAL